MADSPFLELKCPHCGRKLRTTYSSTHEWGLYSCPVGQHQWEVSWNPETGKLEIKGYVESA